VEWPFMRGWISGPRMIPSWAFLVLLVVGGGTVGFANAYYLQAREREAKERLAADAKSILLPEIKSNFDLSVKMLGEDDDMLRPEKLDVDAWETISRGGLLLGLKSDEIQQFLEIYRRVFRANELSGKIIASRVGIESALQGALIYRQTAIDELRRVLNELQPPFSKLLSQPG
jgi:hypothetical protein